MTALLYALSAAGAVSAVSLVGAAALAMQKDVIHRLFVYFISLSAGGLMGGALFHLLPEAIESGDDPLRLMVYTMAGFCLFFMLEKALHMHHHHDDACEGEEEHGSRGNMHLAYLNLIGDGIHNFIDGIILMTVFAIDPTLGVAVTIATIAHEIPQEIGDFGVLLYAGMTKARALFYNFLSALLAVAGVLAGYFLVQSVERITSVLIPVTAGGFLYIAAADLIPELHKDTKKHSSIASFAIFVLMLAFMYAVKVYGE